MSENPKTRPETDTEFNLKHRITGAAVLLFFGALVIPWLLGPPSEASKQVGVTPVDTSTADISPQDIEAELLGGERVDTVPEETIYISKITPLNGTEAATTLDQLDAQSVASASGEPDASHSNKIAKPVLRSDERAVADQVVVTEKSNPTKLQQKQAAVAPTKSRVTQAGAPVDSAQTQREKQLQAAVAAEARAAEAAANARKIQVGWVVQVGLYTEKAGATAKMDALQKLGFSPQSTIVDTNRGPQTGTRVWLGPFQRRPDAETKNSELRAKTGNDGFIRVYP